MTSLPNGLNRKEFQAFPFHLVDPSPWPIFTSFALLLMAVSAVMCFHGFDYGGYLLSLGFALTVSVMVLWFRDVVSEGTFLGNHTHQVRRGLTIGFVLFVVSEVFAFLSVFWAFFHSSLSPDVTLGQTWPPYGVVALDPFAIPLLNTILLLSSGGFITWAHHALIQGGLNSRRAAIYGTILTVIFAILFTGLQYYEYKEAGFTIADSVFGSAFFASTGLHGLILAPTKFYIFSIDSLSAITMCENYFNNYTNLCFVSIIGASVRSNILREKSFLEWLAGFTDAEGNFNISLRNFKDNHYNSLILTYQIGLHIDDLNVLKIIKNKLQCGHISISGDRCNFFVNDRFSLIHIIIPIFDYVQLNSSKYSKYLIFKKAVKLIETKEHLSLEGKIKIIEYYHKIKKDSTFCNPNININDYWLGGFIDGDGSFSITNTSPRLKFENDIREFDLFNSIQDYLSACGLGKVNIILPRKNRGNSRSMCALEIRNINDLINIIIPKFNSFKITTINDIQKLNSKKSMSFKLWCYLVKIIYYGYHNIEEGLALLNSIKETLNKLSTSDTFKKVDLSSYEIKFNGLFDHPSPYEIKNGIRFIRGTDKLVSDNVKIISVDQNSGIRLEFSSISNFSKALKIDRQTIKRYLMKGEPFKNYKFYFNS